MRFLKSARTFHRLYSGLTHVGEDGSAKMVDISDKMATFRKAHAQATLELPPEVLQIVDIAKGEIFGKKGPVFATAKIAGTMACKKTSDLIPFCHPIVVEDCHIDITLNKADEVQIDCHASTTGKTGVEMEALTAASVAALTVYDMCKAVSKGIVVSNIRLLRKSGGKSGEWRAEDASTS